MESETFFIVDTRSREILYMGRGGFGRVTSHFDDKIDPRMEYSSREAAEKVLKDFFSKSPHVQIFTKKQTLNLSRENRLRELRENLESQQEYILKIKTEIAQLEKYTS